MPAVHRPVHTVQRFVATFGDEPVSYAAAIQAGFSPRALRTAVQRGLLLRPRRGILWAGTGDASSHPVEVRAQLRVVGQGAMASFDSAALLHGIARPSSQPPAVVQLVKPDAAGFTGPGLIVRCSPVPTRDRTTAQGLPCTSIARTAVDLARGRPLHSALIPLDSGARLLVAERTSTSGNDLRHAVRVPEHRAAVRHALSAALDALVGWAGTVAVREALAHVDPASESAAESRSRGWFVAAGLGPLAPGTPIPCGHSTYWADFCVPEHRVIGEVDSWAKYGGTAAEMREAMDRERRRQRELEAAGWRVVRWTSTEARPTVLARVRDALRWA